MCGDKRFFRLKAFQKKVFRFSFRIKNLIKSNYFGVFFLSRMIVEFKMIILGGKFMIYFIDSSLRQNMHSIPRGYKLHVNTDLLDKCKML